MLAELALQVALQAGCSTDVADPALCSTVEVLGHRCRTFPKKRTIENTAKALRFVADRGLDGCEIDATRLRDGTVIVWHDATWRRVADPATLPKGLPTLVRDSTWEQVRSIRTKGGAKISTLGRMIYAAGRHDMDLVVEPKNTIADPATYVGMAERFGVDITFYQRPNQATCQINLIPPFAALGVPTGIKIPGSPDECPMTPAEVAAHGTFVAENAGAIDADLVDGYQAEGVTDVFAKVARPWHWAPVTEAGGHLIAQHPVDAARWTAR